MLTALSVCYARNYDFDATKEKLWDEVAYIARYGNVALDEALGLDKHTLYDFGNAIGRLIEKENPQN